MKYMSICRRCFATLVSAVVIASCAGDENGFVINGKALCDSARMAYMYDGREAVDSASIASNGSFKFKGDIAPDKVYTVFVDNQHTVAVIPDVPRIEIFLGDSTYVKGSPMTDTLNSFVDEMSGCDTEEEYYRCCRSAYMANRDNIVGLTAFAELMYELDAEEFEALLDGAGDLIQNDAKVAKVRRLKETEARTGIGSQMVDFSGVTPEGEAVSLSDFVGRGRYVLVDFWASWCGPCMRSMPGMKNLHEKYHKKGLDIVGVAVWDGDNSRSRERIEEKGMTWPQIFVGDDRTPTDTYGIAGIPHVILFDKEGKIVFRGIPNEDELMTKIGKLLK